MAICPDCDEDHNDPKLIASVTKRLKFRHRLYVGLYFTSIALAGFGGYLAFGLGGPIVAAALFAIHLTHLNIRILEGHLATMRDATRPHKPTVIKGETGGHYL